MNDSDVTGNEKRKMPSKGLPEPLPKIAPDGRAEHRNRERNKDLTDETDFVRSATLNNWTYGELAVSRVALVIAHAVLTGVVLAIVVTILYSHS